MCVSMYDMHATAQMWSLEDNSVKSILSFLLYVGSNSRTNKFPKFPQTGGSPVLHVAQAYPELTL